MRKPEAPVQNKSDLIHELKTACPKEVLHKSQKKNIKVYYSSLETITANYSYINIIGGDNLVC